MGFPWISMGTDPVLRERLVGLLHCSAQFQLSSFRPERHAGPAGSTRRDERRQKTQGIRLATLMFHVLLQYGNKCVRKICGKLFTCSSNCPSYILLLGSVPTKTEEPVQQEPRQPPMTRKECLEVVPVEKSQATKIRDMFGP